MSGLVIFMNEQQFHHRVDELFLAIEHWLEENSDEIDFESQEGLLTIILPSGSRLILSRQAALKEVWLASSQGAYHFRYHQEWISTKGESLFPLLMEIIQNQANITLTLPKHS